MYTLICMSYDGDFVREGSFESIDSAWERSNDMGSRWYFYPIHFVLTSSGKSIADAPFEFEFLKGKRLKTAQKFISEFYKQDDSQ